MNMTGHNDNTAKVGQLAVISAAQIAEAQSEVKDAQKALKDVEKRAEKRGVNMDALKWIMKIRKAGKFREGVQFLTDAISYARAFGDGITKAQIDFFNLLEVQLPLDEQAYSDGFVAGAFNKDTGDNPHDISTTAGQMWLKGWHDGRERRDEIETEENNFQFEHIPNGDDAGDTDTHGEEASEADPE